MAGLPFPRRGKEEAATNLRNGWLAAATSGTVAARLHAEGARLGELYLLIGATMGIVWAVEAALRRRGSPNPWIYGWATSCLFLSSWIAFVCLRDGWGLAWSLGLALVIGPTAYPVLRNMMELIRTNPRRVYIDDRYDDPPLDAPVYQATSFGGTSEPIRAEKAPAAAPPEPPPRVFRWQQANIPEFRRAAVATVAAVAIILAGVTAIMYRPPPTPEAYVQAALVDAGYYAVRVRPAENGNSCAAGRATPYHWTAPGAEGEACRSNGGRVTYWVVRTWRPDPTGQRQD